MTKCEKCGSEPFKVVLKLLALENKIDELKQLYKKELLSAIRYKKKFRNKAGLLEEAKEKIEILEDECDNLQREINNWKQKAADDWDKYKEERGMM